MNGEFLKYTKQSFQWIACEQSHRQKYVGNYSFNNLWKICLLIDIQKKGKSPKCTTGNILSVNNTRHVSTYKYLTCWTSDIPYQKRSVLMYRPLQLPRQQKCKFWKDTYGVVLSHSEICSQPVFLSEISNSYTWMDSKRAETKFTWNQGLLLKVIMNVH